MALRAASLAVLLAAGCGDHRPELSRVGGPLPEPGGVDAGCRPDPEGALPCEVEQVLRAKCQLCHNDEEPRPNFAPFPLLTFADTRFVYEARPVWQRMVTVLETDFMPLRGPFVSPEGVPLTPEEKRTLLDWLGACAPSGDPVAVCGDGGAAPP